MSVSFSVLDLAPVVDGSSVSQALNQSIALAVAAEQLGYRRFWLAEHHNMPGIASSSPAVMIGQVARATETIRVGSGGIMLPNHAPLVVAEQFGTLDALFPDRIDLGIGRAPGTDQVTAHALRRAANPSADDFPQELAQLRAFLAGQFPPEHPYSAITAVPGEGAALQMWMLGSSTYSAQVAGLLGLPFAFARHFAPAQTYDALAVYRDSFRPGTLDEPYAMLTVTIVAAEDDETAQQQAAPHRLAMARLREGGRPGRYPTVAQALAEPLTPMQEATIGESASAWIVGGRQKVADEIGALVDSSGVQEIMVSSMLADFDARLESHQIVADILAPAHA
jgi:luciferase family oxidoreductase group 1